jgi:hypothetical protein
MLFVVSRKSRRACAIRKRMRYCDGANPVVFLNSREWFRPRCSRRVPVFPIRTLRRKLQTLGIDPPIFPRAQKGNDASDVVGHADTTSAVGQSAGGTDGRRPRGRQNLSVSARVIYGFNRKLSSFVMALTVEDRLERCISTPSRDSARILQWVGRIPQPHESTTYFPELVSALGWQAFAAHWGCSNTEKCEPSEPMRFPPKGKRPSRLMALAVHNSRNDPEAIGGRLNRGWPWGER